MRRDAATALVIIVALHAGACAGIDATTNAGGKTPVVAAMSRPSPSSSPSPRLPSYTVVGVYDCSLGNIKRYAVEIVLPGDSTIDQRLAIAHREIERLKGKRPFNAALARFWWKRSNVGKGGAYGSIVYASHGVWDNARDVDTGEYDAMEYCVEF
jgi:hypothetical protein